MYKPKGKIFAYWVMEWSLRSAWKNRITGESVKDENEIWALIDWQHGTWTQEQIHNFCVTSYPGKVMIRIPQNLPHFICAALQMGANGVMIPQVNNYREAEEVIRSSYVYPLGERSLGGNIWFCKKFDEISWQDYLKNANNVLILPQVEHRKALPFVEEMISLKGIDGLFLGSGDFTITNGEYGLPNRTGVPWDQPSVLKAFEAIADAAEKEGKIWGNLANPNILERYELFQRANFLAVSDLSTAKEMAKKYI